MSEASERREAIVDYVRDQVRIPLTALRDWATNRFGCSPSTFYDDVNRLVVRRKLQRIPTGHGDDVVLWGRMKHVADPRMVRERSQGVLNEHLTFELRTQYAADLLRLSEQTNLLLDSDVIRLFRAAVRDAGLPGRAAILKVLSNLARQVAEHAAGSNTSKGPTADGMDWQEQLERLRRAIGPALLEAIEWDISSASWACDILLELYAASSKKKLVLEVLDRALSRAHSSPSFDSGLPGLVRGLEEGISLENDPDLSARVLLRLDQALNDPENDQIRDQARRLRNDLRASLLSESKTTGPSKAA